MAVLTYPLVGILNSFKGQKRPACIFRLDFHFFIEPKVKKVTFNNHETEFHTNKYVYYCYSTLWKIIRINQLYANDDTTIF